MRSSPESPGRPRTWTERGTFGQEQSSSALPTLHLPRKVYGVPLPNTNTPCAVFLWPWCRGAAHQMPLSPCWPTQNGALAPDRICVICASCERLKPCSAVFETVKSLETASPRAEPVGPPPPPPCGHCPCTSTPPSAVTPPRRPPAPWGTRPTLEGQPFAAAARRVQPTQFLPRCEFVRMQTHVHAGHPHATHRHTQQDHAHLAVGGGPQLLRPPRTAAEARPAAPEEGGGTWRLSPPAPPRSAGRQRTLP